MSWSLTDEDRPMVRPLPQDWTDQLTPSVIEDFGDNAGPTTILSGYKREIDFFQLLFPESLFSLIANETNKHTDRTQQKKGQNDNKWHRMDAKEICVFIGMRIYKSIVKEMASKFLWPMEPRLDQSVSNLAQRLLATPYFKHYYFLASRCIIMPLWHFLL